MSSLIRFGISLDKDLLKDFDAFIRNKGYSNRSEAIRDLIRSNLVEEEWSSNKKIAGAIILVYDHHKRELLDKLTDMQHDHHHLIISTQHIHLDHDNCLEIIVIKGSAREVKNLHNILGAIKGIKHSGLSMATTGSTIK